MAAPRAIGKFQVLGTLGKGAHSSILHVRCQSDGRQYALKIVPIEDKDDQKYYEQAQHEFRVGQMLDHVNLIKIIAFEPQRDWLFRVKKVHLLIEYVNGKTLDTVPALSVPRLVQVFHRVAAGLAHMHRRGVYHADLKPNNILLSRAGDVKIIDYGLAWVKGEAKGRVQGTPEYMAPEQSKHKIVTEQSDIYNLGATMYRLTTFRLPPSTVPAPGSPGMSSKVFENLLKPVSEFNFKAPKPLCDLIHKCLAYQADKRPKKVTDVVEQLKALEEKLVRTPDDSLETIEW
jgi:eukaryotic-like serine/threonine-protein kinase